MFRALVLIGDFILLRDWATIQRSTHQQHSAFSVHQKAEIAAKTTSKKFHPPPPPPPHQKRAKSLVVVRNTHTHRDIQCVCVRACVRDCLID